MLAKMAHVKNKSEVKFHFYECLKRYPWMRHPIYKKKCPVIVVQGMSSVVLFKLHLKLPEMAWKS